MQEHIAQPPAAELNADHAREERFEAALALIQTGRIARAASRNITLPTRLVERAMADFRAAQARFARVTGRAL